MRIRYAGMALSQLGHGGVEQPFGTIKRMSGGAGSSREDSLRKVKAEAAPSTFGAGKLPG